MYIPKLEVHVRSVNFILATCPCSILFCSPYGEDGWSPHLKLINEIGSKARNLTINMYYSYHIHTRNGVYSFLLNSCRLFQQYLVDAYVGFELSRLDFYEHNQNQFRSAYVSGIYDAISQGDTESRCISKRVLLSPSFVGGPRYMYNHYHDALFICREYENPQYFIIFTCNVRSRVDIISRGFRMKV